MIQKAPYSVVWILIVDSASRTVTAVPPGSALMHQYPLVFLQLMRHLPLTTFRR
jgi:hypothetical protein